MGKFTIYTFQSLYTIAYMELIMPYNVVVQALYRKLRKTESASTPQVHNSIISYSFS